MAVGGRDLGPPEAAPGMGEGSVSCGSVAASRVGEDSSSAMYLCAASWGVLICVTLQTQWGVCVTQHPHQTHTNQCALFTVLEASPVPTSQVGHTLFLQPRKPSTNTSTIPHQVSQITNSTILRHVHERLHALHT